MHVCIGDELAADELCVSTLARRAPSAASYPLGHGVASRCLTGRDPVLLEPEVVLTHYV
jgi:hypothetical protein